MNLDSGNRYSYQIGKLVMQKHNFSIDTVVQSDYGISVVNNTHNGMLGLLQRHEVDITFSAVAFFIHRIEFVDSMPRVFVARHFITFRHPRRTVQSAFLQPFRPFLWLAIFTLVF